MTRREEHGRRGGKGGAAREAAGRLCLWYLCGKLACRRAQSCCGDPRRCTGLMRDWLGELAGRADPAFAAAERRTLTPAEKRAFAVWLAAVENAQVKPHGPESREDADRMRMEIARKLTALAQQEDWETAHP